MAELVLSGVATALLVALLYCDLRRRRLPNRLVAVYAVLCPVALLASGAAPGVWLQHGLVALVAFPFLIAFFVLGGIGGGDVKLGVAVLAWAGPQAFAESLQLIALSGLVLALLGLVADMLLRMGSSGMPAPTRGLGQKVLYALSAKRGVPYGVALAMGGMAALPVYW